MLSYRICFSFFLACCLSLVFLGLTAVSGQAEDIAAKVHTACTTCHSIDRVCKNIGVKAHDDWATTVHRMVGKKPVLSGSDVDSAITYLASQTGGNSEICK